MGEATLAVNPGRHLSLLNTALDLTLAAVALHGWQVVLLGKRSKKPIGKHWTITRDVDVIRRQLERGGNIGLACGPESGVAVLDGDDLDPIRDMFIALGALAIWVETGSGKIHCYVKWEPDLPAKVVWQGRKVGELQRGPQGADTRNLQQVVLPPSVHPDTGRLYQWRIDPCSPLPTLPAAWRVHLKAAAVRPSPISKTDTTGADFEDDAPWGGPPPEELLRRAMQQPGARQRNRGVKFQCPGCRAKGHDRHMDNAIVMNNGRWGCAVSSAHIRAIGEALGVVVSPAGYDVRVLRRLGLRL